MATASTTSLPPVRDEAQFLNDQAHTMRAGLYELLARLLYNPPDAKLLGVLRDISDIDTCEGKVAMGWALVQQAAVKDDPEAIRQEFDALFIGLGRGEIVPFGSWYLTGFLMEKPVAMLRADLAAVGIERQDKVREPEDHIAALCDAMAIIIRNGDTVGFLQQRAFFADHISPWAGRFHDDLQKAPSAQFYRAVGFLGAAFFEFEQQLLTMQG